MSPHVVITALCGADLGPTEAFAFSGAEVVDTGDHPESKFPPQVWESPQ